MQQLQRLGIERVLDIGSNGGCFGMQLRRCGYTGRIYSLEPSAAAHEQLLVNARADLSWFALAPQETVAAGRCLRAEELRQIEALKIDALEQTNDVITSYLPHIGNVRLLQEQSCCAANFLGQLLERQSGIPELLCSSLP